MLLLILLSFVFSELVSGSRTPVDDERLALLSLKMAIKEDPKGSLIQWNDTDYCSWPGISCRNRRVSSLSLPILNLSGSLPSSLGNLSSLKRVNLTNNRFLGLVPVSLFQAKGLQSLILSGNSFSGSLPSQVGNLKRLQILDVSRNLFNGSLPESIFQCKSLTILDLSWNNFTGPMPNASTNDHMNSLKKFNLSFNEFSGFLPQDMGNLLSVQGGMADFSHNSFSGQIPATFNNLPEKVYIDLSYNNLSGSVPQNGSVMNWGPTALMKNPGLCDLPLEISCPTDAVPAIASKPLPFAFSRNSSTPAQQAKIYIGSNPNGGPLNKRVVTGIIVCDVIGICLVGLLFSYCYSRICACSKVDEGMLGFDKKENMSFGCFSLPRNNVRAAANARKHNYLVPLDKQVDFDLDKLLKAPAFVLGKGGIGIVYKIVLENGLSLVVRRFGEGGSQRFKEFQTEVETIAKIRHPNIVNLRAYYWSGDEKLLIYEFIPNYTLSAALHGKPESETHVPLSWATRMKIMNGIGKGLLHIHEFGLKKNHVHGDLRSSGILLGYDMEPHISDLGIRRIANIADETHLVFDAGRFEPIKVTTSEEQYPAPESNRALKPSQKWDVYSFGVILLEVMTGRSSTIHVSGVEMDLVQWIHTCIEKEKPLQHVLDPHLLSCELQKEKEIIVVLKIAIACIDLVPDRRPSMKQVSDSLNGLVSSSSAVGTP